MTYKIYWLDGSEPPLERDTLTDAMEAAGFPDLNSWYINFGVPGEIFAVVSSADNTCCRVIEAAGVAHELIDDLGDEERGRRTWSSKDAQLTGVIFTALPVDSRSFAAAVCLAAHYAAEWRLEDTRIVHTLARMLDAYAPGGLPRIEVAEWAGIVIRDLTDAGFTVAPLSPAGERFLAWPGETAPAAGPLEPFTQPGMDVAFRAIIGAGKRVEAVERRLGHLMWPVWVIKVPASRLPASVCGALSYLISKIIWPLGVMFGGLYLTCRLGHVPGITAVWNAMFAAGQHGPRWYAAALAGLFAIWFTVGSVAEKLVYVRLQPGRAEGDAR